MTATAAAVEASAVLYISNSPFPAKKSKHKQTFWFPFFQLTHGT